MKPLSLVLPALSLASALAFPTEQVVLGNVQLPGSEKYLSFKNAANHFLSDAKKAILYGKKNMEKWYHDGREYIKQNDLLCELFLVAATKEYLDWQPNFR